MRPSRALARIAIVHAPLLHIGYHKTGTASLQNVVYPNAGAGSSFVAGGKRIRPAFLEVNPFGFDPDAARTGFEPDTEEAESRNLVPVFSAERLFGNPHFGCYDGKTIANRLAAASSDARVLVAIREQAGTRLAQVRRRRDRRPLRREQRPHGAAHRPRLTGVRLRLYTGQNRLAAPGCPAAFLHPSAASSWSRPWSSEGCPDGRKFARPPLALDRTQAALPAV